jgi:hypothetical protein
VRDLPSELRQWVETLCSPACAGRRAGSREGAAARTVVSYAFEGAGLEPRHLPVPELGGVNVMARVGPPGRVVLVGAHYDHLGRAPDGSVYWGADDNAAAVAVLLELAARFEKHPAAGEVVLVAFDGEEPPHFLTSAMGSMAFCAAPPFPLEQIELMIALDLVGHAVGPEGTPESVRRSLFALGAEKSAGLGALAARSADKGVVLRPLELDVIPPLSDYEAFRRAGVPTLFLTCGRWQHYHLPTDTPDRLDYDKLAAVTRTVESLVRGVLAEPPGRRHEPAARDPATTVATLLGLARELAPVVPAAAGLSKALEGVAARLELGRPPALADWSLVLEVLARLEQGLA